MAEAYGAGDGKDELLHAFARERSVAGLSALVAAAGSEALRVLADAEHRGGPDADAWDRVLERAEALALEGQSDPAIRALLVSLLARRCLINSSAQRWRSTIDTLLEWFFLGGQSAMVKKSIIEAMSMLHGFMMCLVATGSDLVPKHVYEAFVQLMRGIVDEDTLKHAHMGVRQSALRFAVSAIILFTPRSTDLPQEPLGLHEERFHVDMLGDGSTSGTSSTPSFVSKEDLRREGERFLNFVLSLFDSDERRAACNASLYMCFCSTFGEMMRRRPSLTTKVLPTLCGASDLGNSLGSSITSTQRTSIEKSLKAVLFALLQSPTVVDQGTLRKHIRSAFEQLEAVKKFDEMVRWLDRQAYKRMREEAAAKQKDASSLTVEEQMAKRSKTESVLVKAEEKEIEVESEEEDDDDYAFDEDADEIAEASSEPKASESKHVFPSADEAHQAATRLFGTLPVSIIVDRIIASLQTMPKVPPAILADLEKKSRLSNREESTGTAGIGADGDGGVARTDRAKKEATMLQSAVQTQFRKHAPPVVAPKLSSSNVIELEKLIMKRLLAKETVAEQHGAKELRNSLICRKLLHHDMSGFVWNQAIDYIGLSFVRRLPLAIQWLFAEASVHLIHSTNGKGTQEGKPGQGDTCVSDRYRELFIKLCEKGLHAEKELDSGFEAQATGIGAAAADKAWKRPLAELLTAVPTVIEEGFESVSKLCETAAHFRNGLGIFRDLAVERFGEERERALSMLFEYARAEDSVIRGPAIRLVADSLFSKPQISASIESHAIHSVEEAIQMVNQSAKTVEQQEAVTRSLEHLARALPLLVAICCETPERLILSLRDAYVQCMSEGGRKQVLNAAKPVGRTLAMEMSVLSHLLNVDQDLEMEVDVNDGGTSQGQARDFFALHMLQLVAESGTGNRPEANEDVVSACKARFQRSRDVSFLLFVLGGLKKQEIITYLPHLVFMPENVGGFGKVISQIFSQRPVMLAANEFLLELIRLPVEGWNTPKGRAIISATDLCLKSPGIFKQDVLAMVLQKAVEDTPVPGIFMRTVMQAVRAHPKLQNFVMNILIRLIDKEVWSDRELWKGFLMCCRNNMPRFSVVLLRLPPAQLEVALQDDPKLPQPLVEYVKANRIAVSANVRELLAKY
ncbi:Symplekin [Porphyridium purpureum]|uniref:Symplekin n=1 Tax=Porphyridium purpureum TaxID=35688 RepID=A0A5J4YUL0_PORPP|nr:Symplekin [Porphyridium purpureum]|eukprot:POR7487..scf227_4